MLFKFSTIVLLAISLFATATITTGPWITGDGASHTAGTGSVRLVQFIALSGNSATVNVGSCPASISSGFPIAPGGGLMFPPLQVQLQDAPYDLSTICYYAASNDKLSIGTAK